ncbi:hypothetical protein ACU635_30995 [[Actinomadura] parvosata]|uniref:hypothetical protein n=1 Tax=[Actinomadura] parvosata TaxID=1955412 RepID=UPI00406C283F
MCRKGLTCRPEPPEPSCRTCWTTAAAASSTAPPAPRSAPATASAPPTGVESAVDALTRHIAGRYGPHEALQRGAAAVAFLLSDDAEWVNGQVRA